MDLDLWNCFGREKTLSYNRRNTVVLGSKVCFKVDCTKITITAVALILGQRPGQGHSLGQSIGKFFYMMVKAQLDGLSCR